MPVINAVYTGDRVAEHPFRDLTGTPARLIRDRAVRRRSCKRHPVTPLARSADVLAFLNPEIGVRPVVVNTNSLVRGMVARMSRAAARKRHGIGFAGLVALFRDRPEIAVNLVPAHMSNFVPTLRREKQKLHKRPKRVGGLLQGSPEPDDLIV